MSEPNSDKPKGVFFAKNVVGGVPWAMVSQLIRFVLYFAISIVATDKLGEDKYGEFAVCRTIGEFALVLCGLGLGTALMRFVPELVVEKSRTGLRRLLTRIALMQAIAVVLFVLLLVVAEPWLTRIYKMEFGWLLLLTGAFTAACLMREYLDNAFTAMFHVKTVSVLSAARVLLSFGLIVLFLKYRQEPDAVLTAQTIAIVIFSILGTVLLVRAFRKLDWPKRAPGIGKRRVLSVSLSSLLNAVGLLLLRRYSEMFLLGAYFTPTVTGIYDIGNGIPLMIISFVPLAIQKLFTSGFAEAYTRDQDCLKHLIASFYKALIITVMPVAVFGFFFSPRAVSLLYPEGMQAAGPIASLFFLVHVLSLISIPLSMAIVAKEKILNMSPFVLLQIVVNLGLDFYLIPRSGMYGAVAAVTMTFLITIPIRLYVVSRLIGGIYFPTAFFLKISAVLFALGFGFAPLAERLNIAGLVVASLVFETMFLALVRILRLIKPEDTEEIRGLGFAKLNKCLDLLTGVSHD